VWAALGALAFLAPALAGAAETRPSKAQAAAAVEEYKAVRGGCAADDAACEGRARQRFVAVVSCVAQGKPSVNPATLQQDFARYVDLVSDTLDAPDASPGPAAGPPCFAAAAGGGAAAPAAPGVAAPAARQAPAAAEEGPSLEALRRFRKQADEQSKPVTALPDTADPSAHDKLKGDLEEMRGRFKAGVPSSGGGGGGGGAVGGGGFVPAPAGVPAAAPAPAGLTPSAPTGTTNITGGPTPPGTTNITGGPTPIPHLYQVPPGTVLPNRSQIQLSPQFQPQAPPPAKGP
jgi:hypothetical protein